MPVTIKSTGGGSVTVQAPNTASDYTVDFPAANGTMIVATGGVVPASQGGTGLSSPGTSGNVLTSDGTNWTSAAPVAAGTIIMSAASSAPSGYLACDGSTYLKSSYPALSTVIGQAPTLQASYKASLSGRTPVYYTNGILFNYIYYSSNGGATWSAVGTNWLGSSTDIPQGNVVWTGTYYLQGVANGGNGISYRTTPNGAGTAVTTNINYGVYGLAWNGSNLAVAGGANSTTLSYSSAGTSWTAGASLGAGGACYDIAYGNGVFVVVGKNTANGVSIWTTTNGTSVTLQTLPAGFNTGASYVLTVVYTNSLFIAVTNVGAVATSTDGVTWTLKAAAYTLSSTYGLPGPPYSTWNQTNSAVPIGRVAYCNGLYFNTSYYSSDLITWKLIPPFSWGTSLSSQIYPTGFFGTDGTTVFSVGYLYSVGCGTYTTYNTSFVPYNYTTATQFVVPNLVGLQAPNQYYYIKT